MTSSHSEGTFVHISATEEGDITTEVGSVDSGASCGVKDHDHDHGDQDGHAHDQDQDHDHGHIDGHVTGTMTNTSNTDALLTSLGAERRFARARRHSGPSHSHEVWWGDDSCFKKDNVKRALQIGVVVSAKQFEDEHSSSVQQAAADIANVIASVNLVYEAQLVRAALQSCSYL